MATNVVGTAYVRLRLLTDSIGKDIASSVEKSDLQNIDVKVKADTAEADAKLAATGAEADDLGRKSPTIKPKVDSKEAEKNLGLLGTAIATLAPTLGPLTLAATAAFAGVAAGAGVALLAVHGVKEEMKNGTAVGEVYSTGLQQLETDFNKLGSTAAKGLLGGFQVAVTEINAIMPNLVKTVGNLSVVMGDLGSRVVVGLVDGLITFEPVMQHVLILADQAALKFAQWATGPGGVQFGSTLSHALDEVIPTLVNLVQAIERLVVAAGPLGSTILSSFQLLSKIILALPMPVLQALILGIVTLKTALTGLAIVDKLSNAFDKFGTSLGKAGITSAAGKFGALGAAGVLAGAALFGLSQIMDENAKHAAEVAKLTQDYTQALEESKGAIDSTVNAIVAQDAVTAGIAKTLAQAGISTQQWVTAIEQGGPALTDLANKLLHSTGPAHLLYQTLLDNRDAFSKAQAEARTFTDAQDAANKALADANPQLAANAKALGLTATAYQTAQTALAKKTETDAKNYALQQLEIAQNYQLAGTQDQLAKAYGITTAQVQSYAAMLGITQKQVQDGQVSYLRYEQAVRQVENAYADATQAGSAFLSSLQTFSSSAGTAADRAQLLGAYLVALQGDMLSFQGAVAGAYQANDNLVKSFDKAQRQAINLKTGLIDVTQAGAGPLIQGLQAMQSAAEKAAEATYQHEVATKGAGKAAQDAATVFKTQTYDALVQDAKQLGITKGEAEKLANQYFALPKDVKTKVQAIGTDPVVTVLNKIGTQLAYLTGHPWNPKVNLVDAATTALQHIKDRLAALDGKTSTVYVREIQQLSKQAALTQAGVNRASGGTVPDGPFTVGEQGWEMGYKQGNQVMIFSNAQSKAMTGLGTVPGYATGTAPTASQLASVRNRALTLRITIDQKDLYNLDKALSGSAQHLADTLHTLYLDLQKAANFQPGRHGQYGILNEVAKDNAQLVALAKQRDKLTAQLTAATQRLASLRQASAQEAANVAGAVVGGFNVTTAGTFQVGSGTYGNAEAILANLSANVGQAQRFASQLAALRRRGLDTHLIRQLGEAGYQTAGANVAALAGASPALIAAINRQFAALGRAGTAAGATVANAVFGKQIAATQAVVKAIGRQRTDTLKAMSRLEQRIDKLATALANRPVQLVANGRELAKVVNDQNKANARRR